MVGWLIYLIISNFIHSLLIFIQLVCPFFKKDLKKQKYFENLDVRKYQNKTENHYNDIFTIQKEVI